MRSCISLLAVVGLVLFLMGCSGGNDQVVMPSTGEASSESRMLWGVWDVGINPETFAITLKPSRAAEMHVDVTGYVIPPACYDCVGAIVDGFIPDGSIYDIKVTLKNPTALTAYDVRGTLLIGSAADNRRLTNADDYTELFDDSTPADRNPFKIFATDQPGNIFKPGLTHQLHYLISIPPPKNFQVKFVVDASWPVNQKDPLRIYDQSISGLMDDAGWAASDVEVYVKDWQDDIEWVRLDATPLGALGKIDLQHIAGDLWSIELASIWGAIPGDYNLWIEAKSTSSPFVLYDKLAVTVFEFVNEPPVWDNTVGITTATPGDGKVIVGFGTASDPQIPVTYVVYYSQATPIDFGTALKVESDTGSPVTVDGLTNGQEYHFAVRAKDSLGLEDNNTNELAATPSLCLNDDVPPETYIISGCHDYYGNPTQATFAVSGNDPNNCTPPNEIKFQWRKKTSGSEWLNNWSTPAFGPNVVVNGLSPGDWDVQIRAIDNGLNADASPTECSFNVSKYAQCSGSTYSNHSGDVVPMIYSVMPRAGCDFIYSDIDFLNGLTLAQVGPSTIGIFDAEQPGNPELMVYYKLFRKTTAYSLDCEPIDDRFILLFDKKPWRLEVFDAKMVFGYAGIDSFDLPENQSWVAVEADVDGGLWAIIKDTSNGVKFALRHYSYLQWNNLGDPTYTFDANKTIDITSQVGTEDDIFDLTVLWDLRMLYIFDVGSGKGQVNVYDISGSGAPSFEQSKNNFFSDVIYPQPMPEAGCAFFGSIQADHVDPSDERCRLLLYARMLDESAEMIRIDQSLNIIDTAVMATAYPSLAISGNPVVSERNLIGLGAWDIGVIEAPTDW